MKAQKRAETAENMCEGLRSQVKQAQTEASSLRGKVSKYEATIAEKDTII